MNESFGARHRRPGEAPESNRAVGRARAIAARAAFAVGLTASAWASATAGAQRTRAAGAAARTDVPPVPFDVTTSALLTLGSPADERLRTAQLIGRAPSAGYLLRSPSVLTRWIAEGAPRLRLTFVLPEVRITRNSALPTSDNDGALWAGRGVSALVRAGAVSKVGRVTLILAPEIATSQNLGFQTTATGPSGQFPPTGPFRSPFFTGAYSADLPLRFGDQRYTVVTPGQSAAYVESGPVAFGVTTENEWWGPGVRNALLISNAAEGVPRLFARTRRPLRTRLGDVDARWFVGAPTASIYDAPAADSGRRTLTGGAVTLRARADTNLTLGVARLVLTARRSGGLLAHAFDVVTRNADLGRGDTLAYPRASDQLASVFTRYLFPDAGLELYGEFARLELPRSLRDVLIAPQNTSAYTLGLARAWPMTRARALRAQLEVTNLEQSRTFTDRPPPPDYYTGRAASQGFTSRGQVLGAAIGPGSSGQWLAIDYYVEGGQAGVFLQRSRNQNDALYRQFLANNARHDVTLGGGLRAGARLPGIDARAELAFSNRLNYLFQNGAAYTFQLGTVDIRNVSFALDLSPRGPRARR